MNDTENKNMLIAFREKQGRGCADRRGEFEGWKKCNTVEKQAKHSPDYRYLY